MDTATDVLPPAEAYAVIEPCFTAIKERFLAAGLRVENTKLVCDPKQHDSARHFAACRDDGRLVLAAPELANLGMETALGILAHELGHATDFLYPAEFVLVERRIVRRDRSSETEKQWGKFLRAWAERDHDTVELTADAIAEFVTGVPIGYRGPCLLQSIASGRGRPIGLR